MTTKKTGLFLISGLSLIGFIFLISTQENVIAKSQNSVMSQTNKNQEINQKPTITETITPTVTITETQEQGKNNKGEINSETHRSVVATFVQDLLSVADRNTGIGESVRVIAQEQNDSEKDVTEEISAVENRSKVKTFFIGSDYKNLGALRSEMVKTNNRIDQLKRLINKTTNTEDKTTLQNQITTLEREQTKINDFITQNESKFSLFGWVAKFFTK